ncbi:MAG TPA: GGDEF domain-containing protein [Noviherbaspirillum sp.]
MQDKPQKPEQQSPADIAREAFRRLAVRRIVPTPDAYREIYEEIAGSKQPGAEKALSGFVDSLGNITTDAARLATPLREALAERDWPGVERNLSKLVEQHLKRPAEPAQKAAPAPPPKANPIPLVDDIEPAKPKSASIPLVDVVEAAEAKTRSIPLVDDAPALVVHKEQHPVDVSAVQPVHPLRSVEPAFGESHQIRILRDLLIRTLTLAVGALLRNAPELAKESEELAASVREARTEPALNEVSARLKQLCFKIELKSDDMAEEHELLLRLFRLLLENVSELMEDDSWLSGQIASVQHLLSGPISYAALLDATRSLKEVIYKQGLLKHSLAEAKVTVKNMMMTFVDRLSAAATSTGEYHRKIDQYSQKINQAKGIPELNNILQDVMRDTKVAQADALRARDDMLAARKEVEESEARIQVLESKLEELSELVREDQLTGSLNRRGLDDVLERELARSERRKTPLCVALLDLDDFKRLNDTHGHSAGDEALIHLVKVVKDTLRTMDVIARFGGEEFMIVLPETTLDDAMHTVTRVQRELTKQIFMFENKKLLITFSAGVALHAPGEDPALMIKRADEALYRAKRAGKNRVVAAN